MFATRLAAASGVIFDCQSGPDDLRFDVGGGRIALSIRFVSGFRTRLCLRSDEAITNNVRSESRAFLLSRGSLSGRRQSKAVPDPHGGL